MDYAKLRKLLAGLSRTKDSIGHANALIMRSAGALGCGRKMVQIIVERIGQVRADICRSTFLVWHARHAEGRPFSRLHPFEHGAVALLLAVLKARTFMHLIISA